MSFRKVGGGGVGGGNITNPPIAKRTPKKPTLIKAKTRIITNLKPLDWWNESFSLFLTDSVFFCSSSRLKEFKISTL